MTTTQDEEYQEMHDDKMQSYENEVVEGDASSNFILFGNKVRAQKLPAALYIVATPIGHLKDMTIRALEVLAAADLIACEDTRVSRKLLTHYGIRTRLITYHEHNADKQRPYLLQALKDGKAVALISDAGTPLLSDPGYKLVADMIASDYDVVPIPGASAMLSALVAAGLPTDQIHFAGFLPQKAGARDRKLADLSAVPGTLVFYESPRRLGPVLTAMANMLGGERSAVIGRELTKKFENFHRGPLHKLAEHYATAEAPKGEAVILLGPGDVQVTSEQDIETMILEGLQAGLHVKQLSADIATKVGAKKNDIYKLAQSLKDRTTTPDES
ncbi:16S rRNA (cytidine(1402)-2'-O)-methyltransferase [Cohaesibacter celericrescens]|uniref:Ribosomal RNA small subunit methyltransferase I n=1 Tax=Cohaesibacter celericrescens TaxID=2067669 RepID=A0A2N5XP57_9HYPH|nr:16S rRNA (cytidine(1402)-2'-O)-methyltransferase [Cohaesibacter celericrescens]PLW76208.1 16S rRNA (cytidine(1402)-2'-O)-methyltransferase [Cohaesibacter celericrescens]